MKKALITGITGFVGNHLKDFLEVRGEYEVYGITSNTSRVRNNIFYANLTDFQALKNILSQIKPDEIYHLGALASPKESFDAPLMYHQVNYLGTLNLYEAIKEVKFSPNILFVSSSEVYGSPSQNDLPLTEKSPIHPESPYAASKAAAEIISQQYNKTEKLNIKIARPFNHFGTGQDEKFVLSSFTRQITEIIKKNTTPVIYTGNLSAKRDFTNVNDVVRAYHSIQISGKTGETYNICTGKSCKIEECLNILRSFADKEIEVKKDKNRLRKSDIEDYFGSYEKLNKITGWKPEISLEKGLKELFNYYLES
ncbi:MAG: GDP-mannose 4,6-dehydratase [Nitrospinae bacterium]|nr:GDP-mannose 4,6-dehydratase [Nitrospinota bacterium]